ncbi:anti-sigma factor [Sediminibacillus albus]|uniref:Sigma factor regulator N-terminal n=1 Tax=Sediminibacillus albus TaxID=407036 RepID=A0A1G9A2K0_9BACI|nr:anti-sigma factor [Sediminibacillus albus]SDK21481.1 Sigma factor regulator N-terminal [Sediminibacillus albus]
MSDDFKKKLDDYAEGKLSSEEEMELNRELEKMEQYQAYIEEQVGPNKNNIDPELNNKRQKEILKKGKWKARFQNAITALSILVVITILCSFITNVFYAWGDRGAVYDDVIESTIALTEPNLRVTSKSFSPNSFFTMNWSGELAKEIGNDVETINKLDMKFLLHSPINFNLQTKDDQNSYFISPNDNETLRNNWGKLEVLPEGTVVEAYISFDQFYTTAQVFNKLKGKNYRPVWFAVNSGPKTEGDNNYKVNNNPIGMPFIPVKQTSSSESGGISSQEIINNPDTRNSKFIQTLHLIKDYEHIAEGISTYPSFNLENIIRYIEEHGVNIYGAVITGPKKEILNLQNEDWVSTVQVGEARLWNWN